MHEELQLALWDCVTPEYLYVLLEANRALEAMGGSNHLDELQQVMGLQDGESDTDLLVSRITAVLSTGINDALTRHGLVTTEDTSLPMRTQILEALSTVEDYILPESLLELVSAGIDHEEALTALLSELCPIDELTIQDHLESVDPDLVPRIKEVLEQNCSRRGQVAVANSNEQRKRLQLINQLRQRCQGGPHLVVEQLELGMAVGQPCAVWFEQLFEPLENLSRAALGMEILGITIAGDGDLHHLSVACRQNVMEFTERLDEQNDILSHIRGAIEVLSHG